jgi:hypothetical protein
MRAKAPIEVDEVRVDWRQPEAVVVIHIREMRLGGRPEVDGLGAENL